MNNPNENVVVTVKNVPIDEETDDYLVEYAVDGLATATLDGDHDALVLIVNRELVTLSRAQAHALAALLAHPPVEQWMNQI